MQQEEAQQRMPVGQTIRHVGKNNKDSSEQLMAPFKSQRQTDLMHVPDLQAFNNRGRQAPTLPVVFVTLAKALTLFWLPQAVPK